MIDETFFSVSFLIWNSCNYRRVVKKNQSRHFQQSYKIKKKIFPSNNSNYNAISPSEAISTWNQYASSKLYNYHPTSKLKLNKKKKVKAKRKKEKKIQEASRVAAELAQ